MTTVVGGWTEEIIATSEYIVELSLLTDILIILRWKQADTVENIIP